MLYYISLNQQFLKFDQLKALHFYCPFQFRIHRVFEQLDPLTQFQSLTMTSLRHFLLAFLVLQLFLLCIIFLYINHLSILFQIALVNFCTLGENKMLASVDYHFYPKHLIMKMQILKSKFFLEFLRNIMSFLYI